MTPIKEHSVPTPCSHKSVMMVVLDRPRSHCSLAVLINLIGQCHRREKRTWDHQVVVAVMILLFKVGLDAYGGEYG